MEILLSLRLFVFGILKRIWLLLPAFISDPLDIAERLGMSYDFPQWISWFLLGLGIIVAIFLTYHDLRQQKLALEKQLNEKTKIRRKPVLKAETVFEAHHGKFGQTCGLRILNDSVEEAHDCKARLIELAFFEPMQGLSLDRWPLNQELQMDKTIRANSTANLDVTCLVNSHGGDLQIAYKDITIREDHKLARDIAKGILFMIDVSSKDTEPLYSVCLLSPRLGWGYDFKMITGNLAERPGLNSYQQSNSRRGDYQK